MRSYPPGVVPEPPYAGAVQGLVIAVEDPGGADARALLARHLAFARRHSPPEDVHALDVVGLQAPAVTFVGARLDGSLVAVGALAVLEDGHAELKSMHTAEEYRGLGLGRAVLVHLLTLARARGVRRVSLETGSMDAFGPARALYADLGFVPCPPYGAYTAGPNSTCLSLLLDPPHPAGRGQSSSS